MTDFDMGTMKPLFDRQSLSDLLSRCVEKRIITLSGKLKLWLEVS